MSDGTNPQGGAPEPQEPMTPAQVTAYVNHEVIEFLNGEARVSDGPIRLAVTPPIDTIKASIVEDLEKLLERARAGELESLAWFVTNATSRRIEWGASGSIDEIATIGRLEVLRHSMLNSFAGVEEGCRL